MANAKFLRKNQTDVERRLWYVLRNRQLSGYKFRRQHPFLPYVVDFVCLECKLVIEVDGGQHADTATQDKVRTIFLQDLGYRVLRFWNNEVIENLDGVLTVILAALVNPSPQPSPLEGARE